MEITFELEDSNIECNFEPDFRVQANTSDLSSVQWRLPNRKSSLNMGVLCSEFSDEISTDTPVPGGSNV